ncbi:MAG: hypothetical protein MMC33_004417 [Icmadophila ericetorum]|nr:hypothetical protein [Icmadophila ericetorum]
MLRLLHNTLATTIESWESFEDSDLEYFRSEKQRTLRKTWDSYMMRIEEDLKELWSLRRILQQKMEMFDNMRNGLVNASMMVESRVATDQGKKIGRLTRVTVAYLPLSLGTAIFSMVNWS